MAGEVATKQTLFDIADTLNRFWEVLEDPEGEPEFQRQMAEQLQQFIATDLAEKVDGYGWVDREKDARKIALKKLIADASAELAATSHQQSQLRYFLKLAMQRMGVTLLKGYTTTISIKAGSERVDITDLSKVPEQYIRVIPEQKQPDKVAIARALRRNEQIDGARMVRDNEEELRVTPRRTRGAKANEADSIEPANAVEEAPPWDSAER